MQHKIVISFYDPYRDQLTEKGKIQIVLQPSIIFSFYNKMEICISKFK